MARLQALSETLEAIQQIRVSNRETHYYKKLIDSAEQLKELKFPSF